MELYREAGGYVPWLTCQAVDSLDRFWEKGNLYEFPQDVTFEGNQVALKDRPARLWGVGMALALYARYDEEEKAKQIMTIIRAS